MMGHENYVGNYGMPKSNKTDFLFLAAFASLAICLTRTLPICTLMRVMTYGWVIFAEMSTAGVMKAYQLHM